MDIFSFRRSGGSALRLGMPCAFFLLSVIFTNADKGEMMTDTTYSVGKTFDSLEVKHQVYSIEQEGKAIAEIVPALGNNCYPLQGGRWRNVD